MTPTMTVRLVPPDASGGCRLVIDDRRAAVPPIIVVALDGRLYPFRGAASSIHIHPMHKLWAGAARHSQAILRAVRTFAARTRPQAVVEADVAAPLTDWSQGWARVSRCARRH